ncbi:hypothetical protein Tco_0798151 [Tanacetum coccineum]
MTWGWWKLLHIRPIVHDFIWHRIESGSTVFAWFDKFCSKSPLSDVISMRDIHRAGFNAVTKVRDIAIEGHFPLEWSSKYPNLNMLAVPLFTDLEDILEWRDLKGGVYPFLDHLKVLTSLNQVSASFASIMSHLVPISKRRHARSVIVKILVVACSYYIWQERNWRLFRNQKRPVAQLIECIKSSVRLKLLTCRFKKYKAGQEFCRHWNLPDSLIYT